MAEDGVASGSARRCETHDIELTGIDFCPVCQANGPDARAVSGEPAVGQRPIGLDDPSDAESGAPTSADPKPKDSTSDVAVLTVSDDGDGSDEAIIARLKEMRAEEQPAVVFIGFRTAGKTWLVHRFLKVLFDSGLDPNPGFKEIPHGQTVRLEASDKFDFYQVPPRPGTDETFWLIDTPGERTQSLMDLKVEDLWSFVVTLHYASAVVIALPIDVVLFGPLLVKSLRNATEVETLIREAYPEREPSDKEAAAIHEWIARLREDHDGIDRFVRGVHHAASTLSLVRFNDRSATIDWLNKEEYTRLITEQDVRTHRGRAREFEPVGGPTGQDKPTFVALTKADRMVAALFGDSDMPDDPTGELTAVKKRLRNSPQGRAMRVLAERHGMLDASDYPTAHPATFIRRCNANLHVRLIDWFPLSKFDFVSAFFGHDYTNELVNDHYDKHPGFGVEEMLGWVREARKLKGKGHRSPHNIARRAHLVIHDIQGGGGIS